MIIWIVVGANCTIISDVQRLFYPSAYKYNVFGASFSPDLKPLKDMFQNNLCNR